MRNVLFLCTGNSSRSIMAESILRKDGAGRFGSFSAGSQPKAGVNPIALKTLEAFSYPTDGFSSKSWDVFAVAGAPQMDFVLTVCDDAAGEICPIWPGHPAQAHWGIADPAAATGSEVEKEKAFADAFKQLRTRISLFLNLPLATLDKLALQRELHAIGETEGATRQQ